MKKSKNDGFAILLIIIPMCILLGISVANKNESTRSGYAVNSTSKSGYSVVYEALKRLGMNVRRGYTAIEQENTDTCQIVIESEFLIEEIEALEEWVEAGGTLVYIEDSETETWVIPTSKGTWIELGSAEKLTNGYLIEDTEVAYELYETLAQYATGKEIIFNEYYMHSKRGLNLWDVTPIFIKLTLVELALCVILYFWYAGKRFGKVVMLAEEVERTENEYVYAVASLYKKANAWELTVSSYYRELTHRLNALTRREENLVEAWEKEQLPDLEIAKKVNEYVEQIDGYRPNQTKDMIDTEQLFSSQVNLAKKIKKSKKKEVKQILNMMEHLMKIIDQRREQYWKF